MSRLGKWPLKYNKNNEYIILPLKFSFSIMNKIGPEYYYTNIFDELGTYPEHMEPSPSRIVLNFHEQKKWEKEVLTR